MANTKSQLVAARDSGDKMGAQRDDGKENVRICHVSLSGAASLNDTITLCRMGVDEKITSVRLSCDDLGTTGTLDLGFHRVNDDNTIGDAVDVDAIATAIDVNAAALADVEQRFEVKDINTADDRVWELAGLSSRPDYGEVYLSGNFSQATTAGGDIVVIVRSVK